MRYRSNIIEFGNYHYPDPNQPDEHISRWKARPRPVIVCLCGSTRFMESYYNANMNESIAGKIVINCAQSPKGDIKPTPEQKVFLDELHKRKIDLADEVLILNVGGYCGESTRSEIKYASMRNKIIRWLEPDKAGIVMMELGLATVANTPK